MSTQPRVALFCETFHEVNGVALTARQLVAFAKRRGHPFLAELGGPQVAQFTEGSVTRLELPRGWASFGIERDLRYDLFFWRHLGQARRLGRRSRQAARHRHRFQGSPLPRRLDRPHPGIRSQWQVFGPFLDAPRLSQRQTERAQYRQG